MNSQNLQILRTGYDQVSRLGVLAPTSGGQLLIHSVTGYNGTAADLDIGIGIKFNPESYFLYQLPSAVEITSGNIFTTTNNDGFMVGAKKKFSQINFTISSAETGSPVYSYEYWNGSGWAVAELLNAPDFTNVGEASILFNPPVDWTMFNDQYLLRVRATTAPSGNVAISDFGIVQLIVFREDIPTHQQLAVLFKPKHFLLEGLEEIIPYFSVADARNTVEISYQVS